MTLNPGYIVRRLHMIRGASVTVPDRQGNRDVTITRGFWLWRRSVTYRGDCTVFHDIKTGERASGFLEYHLASLIVRARMIEDDELEQFRQHPEWPWPTWAEWIAR